VIYDYIDALNAVIKISLSDNAINLHAIYWILIYILIIIIFVGYFYIGIFYHLNLKCLKNVFRAYLTFKLNVISVVLSN
jgi:hypothetical protein